MQPFHFIFIFKSIGPVVLTEICEIQLPHVISQKHFSCIRLLQALLTSLHVVRMDTFIIANKSHEKTNMNNKVILLTSTTCAAKAWNRLFLSAVLLNCCSKLVKAHQ